MHMQQVHFFASLVAIIGKSFPFDPFDFQGRSRRSKLSRQNFQWKIVKNVSDAARSLLRVTKSKEEVA